MKAILDKIFSKLTEFNEKFALILTASVGTMWCAYVFAGLALVSFPAALAGGVATLVAWTAQTFIQLVLLSVIMVGQDIQSRKTEARDIEDHNNILAEFTSIKEMHDLMMAELQEIKAMHIDLKDMHDNKTGCGYTEK